MHNPHDLDPPGLQDAKDELMRRVRYRHVRAAAAVAKVVQKQARSRVDRTDTGSIGLPGEVCDGGGDQCAVPALGILAPEIEAGREDPLGIALRKPGEARRQ